MNRSLFTVLKIVTVVAAVIAVSQFSLYQHGYDPEATFWHPYAPASAYAVTYGFVIIFTLALLALNESCRRDILANPAFIRRRR